MQRSVLLNALLVHRTQSNNNVKQTDDILFHIFLETTTCFVLRFIFIRTYNVSIMQMYCRVVVYAQSA